MKRVSLLAAAFVCLNTYAQDCKTFLYMTNNAQVQMKLYDAKGRESGTQNWTISDVKQNGEGYESTINLVMTDGKGRELAKSTGTYKCNSGVLKADIRMTMPQAGQMPGAGTTEAKMDAAYLEYPANIAAGQDLKDAEFNMDMNLGNGMPGSAEFKQTGRKVQSKESLTTPAGTWDAYKITYNAFFRAKTMGIGVPMNMAVTEWFVPGIGVVKTETYNKNGKLMGSTVLTAIRK